MFARLLFLFLTVPLIELYLFYTIGSRIGLIPTLAIIVLTAIAGAWLTRMQGLRTLQRYQQAMEEGRLPHVEVMDGLMIFVAGAVLLTPGFLTDAIGFLLLVPPVRALVRARLAESLKHRVNVDVNVNVGDPASGPGQAPGSRPDDPAKRIIEGEVIDD